jgi:hypothetical protein
MNSYKIIAFGGKKHCGKTTLSLYHCEKFKYKLINFADSLKNIIAHTLNISVDTLNANKDIILEENNTYNFSSNDKLQYLSDELKINKNIISDSLLNKKFYSIREILQYIGTDIIRKHDEMWHIDRLHDSILQSSYNNFCIGDLRFKNEKDYIQNKLNGKCWYITRSSDDSKVIQHVSENNLNKCDFTNSQLLRNLFPKDKDYLFREWNKIQLS